MKTKRKAIKVEEKRKMVVVTAECKRTLDQFREDFPDYKQIYFVSNAIWKAVQEERTAHLMHGGESGS